MRGRSRAVPYLMAYLVLLCTVCSVAFFPGCYTGDKKIDTGITLSSTKDVFIAAATTAKRLCESGVLSQDECQEIAQIYSDGKKLLIEARALWDEAVGNDTPVPAKYEILVHKAMEIATTIEMIVLKHTT